MKLHISSFDLIIQQKAVLALVEENGGYATYNQATTFCSYEKSYTFREDLSARFLDAFNTDFERLNKQLIRYSPQ